MLESLLTSSQTKAALRAARAGEYHLLLGAGASYGARDRNNQLLSGSARLADELARDFGVSQEEGDLLWRIYDRAVARTSGAKVWSYLNKRLTNARPPDWYESLCAAPWRRVWTLNIDDVFENAYKLLEVAEIRPLRTLSWDDSYSERNTLDVVHLHGHVLGRDPRQLVFSLTEYRDSLISRSAWPILFRDSYGSAPFVIIGARLRDEPDIEAVIRGRKLDRATPCFYVAPDLTPGMREDLAAWGLVAVDSTAESFAQQWQELLGPAATLERTDLQLAVRVGMRFQELALNAVQPAPRGHDLISGDEPLWSDVAEGRHASLPWYQEVATSVLTAIDAETPGVHLVWGGRLTGGSTGLLAVAHAVRLRHITTLLYSGGGRLDLDALLAFAARQRAVLLLFDGGADVVDDVDHLIKRAKREAPGLVAVVLENRAGEAGVLGRLGQEQLLPSGPTYVGKLTPKDGRILATKLHAVGRLGVLESKTVAQRVAHFVSTDIFSAMAEVEQGEGYRRRLADVIAAVPEGAQRELLLLSAYANRSGRTLARTDVAIALGLRPERVNGWLQRHDTPLRALLEPVGSSIRTRQRDFALEPCVDLLGEVVASEVLLRAVRRLAPLVTPSSQRSRNSVALLVADLMTYRALRKVLRTVDLDEWYESMRDVFGSWNGRYWEQRAKLCRSEGIWDAAESYAERAVTIREDTYSLTTLGTVLLRKAGHLAELGETTWFGYYQRAWVAYSAASELEPNNLVTWFAYSRAAVDLLNHLIRTQGQSSNVGSGEVAELVGNFNRTYATLRVLTQRGAQVDRELTTMGDRWTHLVAELG